MGAIISSRTPEGRPILCDHCGLVFLVEPSSPGGDAPCPCCGQLLWFELGKTAKMRDFPEPCPGGGRFLWHERPPGDRPPPPPAPSEAPRDSVVETRRPLWVLAKQAWISSFGCGWKRLSGIVSEAEAWLKGRLPRPEALWMALEPLTLHPPFPPPRRRMYGDFHPTGMPCRKERQVRVSLLQLFLLLVRPPRPRRAQAPAERPTSEPSQGLYDAWLDGYP